MTHDQIADQIRQILARIVNLDPAAITADVSFRDELGIDSLALLEAGVDVDYTFKLAIPELDDLLKEIDTLGQMTTLIAGLLEQKNEVAAA